MYQEKSTYEKFESFQQQVVGTIIVVVLGIYLVICARNFFVSPQLVETGLLQSEKQAFQDGVNAGMNQ